MRLECILAGEAFSARKLPAWYYGLACIVFSHYFLLYAGGNEIQGLTHVIFQAKKNPPREQRPYIINLL